MSKKHMKNNEVDLDEVTPNLVPPKEKLDLWKDMLEHPENHEVDFERIRRESEESNQQEKLRLEKLIETGLYPDGCKVSVKSMCSIKKEYDRRYNKREDSL